MKFKANKSKFIHELLKMDSSTSPPRVNAENAIMKSPVIAPIPTKKVENQAVLRVTELFKAFFIISRLIGPSGAARVTPKDAVTIQILKNSKMFN